MKKDACYSVGGHLDRRQMNSLEFLRRCCTVFSRDFHGLLDGHGLLADDYSGEGGYLQAKSAFGC